MRAKKSEKKEVTKETVLNGVFELVETHGWAHLTFHDITDHLGISLFELHRFFPSKYAILTGMIEKIDQETLERVSTDIKDLSPKDRLFDVLMARFDASKPYKHAIRRMWHESLRHPMLIVGNVPLGYHSMVWILEAAGVHNTGLMGFLQVKGFGLLYLKLIHAWLDDDSEDMSKTMSEVDKHLNRFGDCIFRRF